MEITIRTDDLSSDATQDLLRTHLKFARASSPSCMAHALDLTGLQQPDVMVWTAWQGETILGCAALRELSPTHGEIKSMHTAKAARGQGLGSQLLEFLINTAITRNYTRISLETGNNEAFAAARSLYRQFGFVDCPPFAQYTKNDFSMCMTLVLNPTA